MKTRFILTVTILLKAISFAWSQPSPIAYQLYNNKGDVVSYQQMIKDLALQDVVFIGEMHNCVITHWLERCILQSLYDRHGQKMALGMEMFESDNQLIIDEYQKGLITAERFEAEVRLWPNYSTDYEPLVDFATEHHLRVLATNVPRRYANGVRRHGLCWLDSLSQQAKSYLPPLPISYQKNEQAESAFSMMAMMGKDKKGFPDGLGQSQALKDATMAWNIARCKDLHILHVNGNYHTDSGDGIIPYLLRYRPGITYKTIYAVRQQDVSKLESDYLGKADYYICVPETMSMSY